METQFKKCKKCSKEKELDKFAKGRNSCRLCHNEQVRIIRGNGRQYQINDYERLCLRCKIIKSNENFFTKTNDQVIKKRRVCSECQKADGLLKKYGMSITEYETQLKKQNGVCSICNRTNKDGRKLSIDHNHLTGQIRGLLCGKCNMGLGLLHGDDGVDLLIVAIEYVNSYKNDSNGSVK